MTNSGRHTLIKILVVERDAARFKVLQKSARQFAPTAQQTTDYIDALYHIKHFNYDVVICPLVLPQMDGFELMERALQLAPETRFIILLSGDENEAICMEANQLGAFACIARDESRKLTLTLQQLVDEHQSYAGSDANEPATGAAA
jgi:two-component system, NtrC family, nitrogen regulation response regulator NtrX